ncbi:lipocalin family protein [Maricaulis sp.]|uniref:lipocalin family protein n=1 Tax=Maricaulis sp. TaxID=1486257 RepID=UPI0025BB4008|nr:lipocalin family protein [Maricaulis sp.]
MPPIPRRFIPALLIPILALAACTSPPRDRLSGDQPPATVSRVDVERYLGRWFEIARADHGFERGCDGVIAEYSRRPDGLLRVINSCWKEGLEGPVNLAEGRARIVDTDSNAKLEVSFFGPFFGDYWIIDLAEDYSWAVVSEAQGRYLWILARDPRPSEAFIAQRLASLEARGFDTDGLIFPEQWPAASAAPTSE